jgi:hypothetical protein
MSKPMKNIVIRAPARMAVLRGTFPATPFTRLRKKSPVFTTDFLKALQTDEIARYLQNGLTLHDDYKSLHSNC